MAIQCGVLGGLQAGLLGGLIGCANGPAFGVDPNWSDVTFQVNFSDHNTGELAGGFLDDTGNHLITFDGGCSIDSEGFLVGGNFYAGTGDYGAFNNNAGAISIGGMMVMFKNPTGVVNTTMQFGYNASEDRGAAIIHTGVLFEKSNRTGSETSLQIKTGPPDETLGIQAFEQSSLTEKRYLWATDGVFNQWFATANETTLQLSGNRTFTGVGAKRIKSVRFSRGSIRTDYDTMLANGGFPVSG